LIIASPLLFKALASGQNHVSRQRHARIVPEDVNFYIQQRT